MLRSLEGLSRAGKHWLYCCLALCSCHAVNSSRYSWCRSSSVRIGLLGPLPTSMCSVRGWNRIQRQSKTSTHKHALMYGCWCPGHRQEQESDTICAETPVQRLVVCCNVNIIFCHIGEVFGGYLKCALNPHLIWSNYLSFLPQSKSQRWVEVSRERMSKGAMAWNIKNGMHQASWRCNWRKQRAWQLLIYEIGISVPDIIPT